MIRLKKGEVLTAKEILQGFRDTPVDFTRNHPDFIMGKGGDPRFVVHLPIPPWRRSWIRRAVRRYDRAKDYLRSLEGGCPTAPDAISACSHPGFFQMLEFLKRHKGIDHMVEVGAYLGESTAVFGEHFKTVHSCDPWEPEFMASMFGRSVDREELWYLWDKNTKGAQNIFFTEKPSVLYARNFQDGSLDFVYIDGWHRVIPCLVDILTWLPKIRKGGFIGGHDYRTHSYSEVIPAVRYTLGAPDVVFPDSSWLKRI